MPDATPAESLRHTIPTPASIKFPARVFLADEPVAALADRVAFLAQASFAEGLNEHASGG